MDGKPFYLSKTIWANVIAIGAAILGAFNIDVDPETQAQIAAGIVAVANIILRFVTKEPIA
jgi:hypothetical protein